jgi:RNA polymerase sigma-70 factor (ECF subfamily)
VPGEGGHQDEFEATALPFAWPLYSTALRLTGRAEDALDIVQETFLRAFRTFHNFRAGTNPKAWLFTILRSVAANRHRDDQRRPRLVPVDDLDERFAAHARSGPPGFELDKGEVERALATLPEEFKTAVLLVDVEELTYEEAAAVLGCPVGTVRSRLARGRRGLAVALHDYAAQAGYSSRNS